MENESETKVCLTHKELEAIQTLAKKCEEQKQE